MAGLARSPKGNRTIVVKVKDKKEFVKEFNSHVPSEEELKKIRKIGGFLAWYAFKEVLLRND